MSKITTKNLTVTALIAAIYVQITFFLTEISYGAFQFRLSEALTILPIFSKVPIYGVTLGCFISNIIGFLMGKDPLIDLFIGTAATLISAILTYYIGKISNKFIKLFLAPLPAVIINGLVIGTEISIIYHGVFLFNIFSVAFGEFVVCYLVGVPLAYILLKNDFYKKIF